MLPERSSLHALLTTYLRPAVLAAATLLMVGNAAWADKEKEKNSGPVKLLTTIPIPPTAANVGKNLYSYDISFVDQKTETYYLADRSSNASDTESFEIADVKVRVFGDSALVTGISKITERRQGNRYRFSLRWKELWVREAQNWRVLAGQATPVNPKGYAFRPAGIVRCSVFFVSFT